MRARDRGVGGGGAHHGGRWSRHDHVGPLIRFATRLLRVVPVGPVRTLARGIGSAAYYVLGARRRTVLQSVAALRPTLGRAQQRRVARRTFGNLAAASVDLFRLPAATRDELDRLVTVEGLEHLDHALSLGKGVLVVTAHLGAYELGGACLTARGYSTYAVVEDLSPEVYDALASLRSATGMRLINLRNAIAGTYRALKENAIVLLVADRVIGDRTRSLTVPFGAGWRDIPVGPASFAVSTGAPIVIGFVCQAPAHSTARYIVHFDPRSRGLHLATTNVMR
ncbi:MAG: lysophospholipid acyltransferase family protein [Gemmatimonadaceae bacterium]